MARPENGYRFVSWTGDVDTIDDADAAQTAITMNDEYSIAANFERGQPVNWALIGGIVGAVVIVGLVLFFVRRKKGVQKEGREKKATRTKGR